MEVRCCSAPQCLNERGVDSWRQWHSLSPITIRAPYVEENTRAPVTDCCPSLQTDSIQRQLFDEDTNTAVRQCTAAAAAGRTRGGELDAVARARGPTTARSKVNEGMRKREIEREMETVYWQRVRYEVVDAAIERREERVCVPMEAVRLQLSDCLGSSARLRHSADSPRIRTISSRLHCSHCDDDDRLRLAATEPAAGAWQRHAQRPMCHTRPHTHSVQREERNRQKAEKENGRESHRFSRQLQSADPTLHFIQQD